MTITLAWNGGQHAVMFTPRLSVLVGLFGILAFGLFALITLALGFVAGLLYLAWVSICAVSSVPFVLPTLSSLLLGFLAVLLLIVIGRLLLALIREYQIGHVGKTGVA